MGKEYEAWMNFEDESMAKVEAETAEELEEKITEETAKIEESGLETWVDRSTDDE